MRTMCFIPEVQLSTAVRRRDWNSKIESGFPTHWEVNSAFTVTQTAPSAPASPVSGPVILSALPPFSPTQPHGLLAVSWADQASSSPGPLHWMVSVPGLAPQIATWLLTSLCSDFRQCHLITKVLARPPFIY